VEDGTKPQVIIIITHNLRRSCLDLPQDEEEMRLPPRSRDKQCLEIRLCVVCLCKARTAEEEWTERKASGVLCRTCASDWRKWRKSRTVWPSTSTSTRLIRTTTSLDEEGRSAPCPTVLLPPPPHPLGASKKGHKVRGVKGKLEEIWVFFKKGGGGGGEKNLSFLSGPRPV
ncbi:hypothetical protein Fcan01_19779, partial [Folsomia candida]